MNCAGKNVSNRFELLDLARGVAAVGILLFHAYPIPIFSTLYTFVDFFFVLSGFVLAPSYLRLTNFAEVRQFLINRAYRLFPMVFATLLFVLGIQVIVDFKHFLMGEINNHRIDTSFQTLLAAFGLIQIFSNAATLLNPPLWSLSAEWISNITAASRLKFRRWNPFVLLVTGCLLIGHFQFSRSGWEDQLGRGMSGFYLGIILRQICLRKKIGSRYSLLLSLILVIIMNVAIYFIGSKLSYLSPLIYGLAIVQLSSISVLSGTRTFRISNIFGRYSYGFYAWHFPLLSLSAIIIKKLLTQFNFSSSFSQLLTILLCTILTITFTHLTIKYLETPLRSRRARKIA